jgi:hypothetical protein
MLVSPVQKGLLKQRKYGKSGRRIMDKKTRKIVNACLEILIHQIYDELPEERESAHQLDLRIRRIYSILNSWIEANHLHPEKVKTMTMEEFKKWVRKGYKN